MDSDGVAPDTPARLMSAAVQELPISDSILAACLRRLRAEGAEGFRAARMALIKLTLIRKGIQVTEMLDNNERHPAYVYGRLFANAQNHLRKLRSEKPGAHVNNDKLLSEVVALLPASPPYGHLSLQDQGRFALGYYHQRAKRFQQIAERKAAKAEGEGRQHVKGSKMDVR